MLASLWAEAILANKPLNSRINTAIFLFYNKDKKTFLNREENIEAIKGELQLCGYIAVIMSENMTSKEPSIYIKAEMFQKN